LKSILAVLQTHVDEIDDSSWNLVVQILLYAMSPRCCGSVSSSLEKLVNELLIHRPNHVNTVVQVITSKLVRMNTGNTTIDVPSVAELKCFDIAIKLFCRAIEIVGIKKLVFIIDSIILPNFCPTKVSSWLRLIMNF